MEKEVKNKFVRKLWNANTAIDIGNILTEIEYEITTQVKKDTNEKISFKLQQISLADDEMASKIGSGKIYRDIVREVLDSL